MNWLSRLITDIYSWMLQFYPGKFKDEFAEEMSVVFRDSIVAASGNSVSSFVLVCIRELTGLPLNILTEHFHEVVRRKAEMTVANEKNTMIMDGQTGNLAFFVGVLPFILFGIASMFNAAFPYYFVVIYMIFYLLVLIGTMFGLTKGVPHWTYGYLGWSMVMAWWWAGLSINALRGSDFPIVYNQRFGLWSWLPLLLAIAIALLWSRSFRPLQKLIRNIWQHWTHLSLMMFTFVAFTQLIYDENHHPFLVVFILGSTLCVSIGAWLFLRSTTTLQRATSLIAGFVFASVVGSISYATWDWATYYGFPLTTPEPWYVAAEKAFLISPIWIAVLFWPVLIGLTRQIFDRRKTV